MTSSNSVIGGSSAITPAVNRILPDCWGHRGASGRFPENTIASFEAAIRDGSDGIESDVHVSADGVVLMFHDPDLSRTTSSTGWIKERNWYGENGMEQVRTVKEPKQAIPTFSETIELLMRPENQHVQFNVDIKVHNDPERLFKLMHEIISMQPSWDSLLAPRILLGLWHPKFIRPAMNILPYCKRAYLGNSVYIAMKYFWDHVDAFSIAFACLANTEGERFRQRCREAGKYLMVWTVNEPAYMMEAARWGVGGIITDVTNTWLELRESLREDYEGVGSKYGREFLWTDPRFFALTRAIWIKALKMKLEYLGGPLLLYDISHDSIGQTRISCPLLWPLTPSQMLNRISSSPRRTHRKRSSAVHLSSDTTASLPEYHQSIPSWQRHTQHSPFEQDIPSDKPPDYPDSAEEADEDTDSENHRNTLYVQQHSLGSSVLLHTPQSASTSSPRRKQRFQHRRKYSLPVLDGNEASNDPLDSLLERSVHALEMSNTLLQSSMTTPQTTFPTTFSYDSPRVSGLESQAMNLSSKITGGSDLKASWLDDMEEVRKRVDSLFGDGKDLSGGGVGENAGAGQRTNDWRRRMNSLQSSNSEAGLSNSLPASASPLQQRFQREPKRRPSLDLREAAVEAGGLRLSHRTREELIAPPPRAITQYIEFDADPTIITMPSTLGLRSSTSVPLNSDWSSSTASLLSSPAKPVVTDAPLPSSSTPAYEKLASFVKRPSNSANATPSSSFKSSFMIPRRMNSSIGASDRERRARSPQRSENTRFRSRAFASPSSPCHHHARPMTPPVEESSSSSDDCIAKQTISCLRKILDEQPVPEVTKRKVAPITLTPPAPVSGTSNATASISRMLTKKLHHSSTRPPSPPRQSAMKGSRPSTPQHPTAPTLLLAVPPTSTSPSTPSPAISDHSHSWGGLTSLITRRPSKIIGTPTSSGRSTPKHISFAELPEAHISSRPDKFRDKGKRKGRKSKPTKAKGIHGNDDEEDSDGGGWLAALFGINPNLGLAYPSTSRDERMEDRIARSWGGRGGGGGYGSIDEWAI
ncbi:hypothetical protein AGABI1DRAFT_127527 [Agaricus bisporus var. burnettii JB137-S8]|uniref:GP-PDE domain-containing protein n=1 Tax=Agaricus bisporus var. burnettii (strain JB137-S8 / ATCC MYA-4627 / FGSC 10392) TaxID=597362 RepID=K5X9E0_AGABU|nr:uncharacterized protein AGABI1DRAFT_127527 [Agaricus bisporus var. burnettii JB137-S8]EKM79843.1 hypothetical protein AGABI1DRAFT_127527 [Agaricus bisporus var. burnettii JB137-S8]